MRVVCAHACKNVRACACACARAWDETDRFQEALGKNLRAEDEGRVRMAGLTVHGHDGRRVGIGWISMGPLSMGRKMAGNGSGKRVGARER